MVLLTPYRNYVVRGPSSPDQALARLADMVEERRLVRREDEVPKTPFEGRVRSRDFELTVLSKWSGGEVCVARGSVESDGDQCLIRLRISPRLGTYIGLSLFYAVIGGLCWACASGELDAFAIGGHQFSATASLLLILAGGVLVYLLSLHWAKKDMVLFRSAVEYAAGCPGSLAPSREE